MRIDNSRRLMENEILEFIQGVAGSGVPIVDSNEYSVVLEGKRRLDGFVSVAKMGETATENLFAEMNDLVFGKFGRTIDVKGRSIFVSASA